MHGAEGRKGFGSIAQAFSASVQWTYGATIGAYTTCILLDAHLGSIRLRESSL
jgi:hypothetical protein